MSPRNFRWTPAVILVIAGSTHSLAASPFPAVLELSSLDGTNGFVINGVNERDHGGQSVSAAGDINGDGVDDLIIGAYRADPNGLSDAGESYVVFGSTGIGGGGSFELSALNGANGFVCKGAFASDESGWSVSSAGDVNGDGVDDLIIGAPDADSVGLYSARGAGVSYVVFGGAGVGVGGVLELSALNGMNGFVCNGIDEFDYSGRSVSSAGDINGDGIDDLIIGAVGGDPMGTTSIGPGQSCVIFGGASVGVAGILELSSLNGTNGFVCNGIAEDIDGREGQTGYSVSAAGDVNGDGVDDLIIGDNEASPNGLFRVGKSFVIFGGDQVGTGGIIELSSLKGSNGFVINGVDSYDHSGQSVSKAGDVNGDGVDDLIIGAKLAGSNYSQVGVSYVIFGSIDIGANGTIELSSLNGVNGFAINGIDVQDESGSSVSYAGDVNGDGVDDLIIGAPRAVLNNMGSNGQGESYVVFGAADIGASGTLELSSLDGDNGFTCIGVNESSSIGNSVSNAGDVNGDGIDDFIIGEKFASPNGFRSGRCHVVFGRCVLPADINDDKVVDMADLGILLNQFGTTGSGADINGDDIVDTADLGILLGSFGNSTP